MDAISVKPNMAAHNNESSAPHTNDKWGDTHKRIILMSSTRQLLNPMPQALKFKPLTLISARNLEMPLWNIRFEVKIVKF